MQPLFFYVCHMSFHRAQSREVPESLSADGTTSSLTLPLLSFLLLASGAVALTFQVLWIKQLSLIVGVEVHAVTISISSFFAGLSLGGLTIGRLADRVQRPLRLYVALEVIAAVAGTLTTVILANFAAPFAYYEAKFGVLVWVVLLVMVAVAPFFMGGTLPAVIRALGPRNDRIASGGGWLYAANTLGAVLGALLCSFLLIPSIGIFGTALAASGLGCLAAIIGLLFDRFGACSVSPSLPLVKIPLSKGAVRAIFLYAIAGGIAMGYEVVWSQAIVQFMSTRTFAFSVMLAVYLIGLAAGSAFFGRFADRISNPWSVFGLLIAGAGLISLLEITFLGSWLMNLQSYAEYLGVAFTGSQFVGMCARFAVVSIYIVLVPTFLLGAAFPMALRLIGVTGHVGRDVGIVVALNTLGGIIGVVLTGFLLIPYFGVVYSLALLALIASLIGVAAMLNEKEPRLRLRNLAIMVPCFVVIASLITPRDRLASSLIDARGGELIFYEESAGGTVAVLEQGISTKRFRRLYIQGVSNSGDTMTSLRYMRLQALLPLIIHSGDPLSALVIGFGTGITAGSLLVYPGLESRVVVELMPEVVRAGPLFQGNFSAAEDPRLEIRLRDGRRELLSSNENYDLITLEPPPPAARGVVNLYSSDFYELARARLRPGGIVAQWLPLPTQNDEDTRSLVRSFLDVFPHVSLWTTEIHEMLLVGSLEPFDLFVPRIKERFSQAGVAAALHEVGISTPEALLGTWVTDRAGLEAYAKNALPVTDDRPRIEYADWVRHDEIHRVLPNLIKLFTPPPLRGADSDFIGRMNKERERLHLFYQASLNAEAGNRNEWARDMKRVFDSGDSNVYYEWFIRGALRDEDINPD